MWRYVWCVIFTFLGLVFLASYVMDGASAWPQCYGLALICVFLYLWQFRRNLFSTTTIFVLLSVVAITFPVVPYLVFDLEFGSYFYDSIYINTLGLYFFLAFAVLLSPTISPQANPKEFLKSVEWERFFKINQRICIFTFPFVLVAITVAGAWGALLSLQDSSFDRIASMKGLGPLMIFSVMNVVSAFFWAVGLFTRHKQLRAIALLLFILFVNGFTYGRGNLIFVFFGSLLFYLALRGVSLKVIIAAALGGIFIILLKVTRGGEQLDLPWQLMFFLHFAGDFDSLNNSVTLIEYTKQNGFFGLYHIWSNLLVYIPREIFPGKPHDLGGLYLNTFLFPGVYLGAEGGTGLALGFQGIWYAVAGLPSLVIGNLLLAWILCSCDRAFKRKVKIGKPSLMLIAYIMLIGQSIILYRDGFYAFMNVGFYIACYWAMYKIFSSTRGLHETASASRPLASARG